MDFAGHQNTRPSRTVKAYDADIRACFQQRDAPKWRVATRNNRWTHLSSVSTALAREQSDNAEKKLTQNFGSRCSRNLSFCHEMGEKSLGTLRRVFNYHLWQPKRINCALEYRLDIRPRTHRQVRYQFLQRLLHLDSSFRRRWRHRAAACDEISGPPWTSFDLGELTRKTNTPLTPESDLFENRTRNCGLQRKNLLGDNGLDNSEFTIIAFKS